MGVHISPRLALIATEELMRASWFCLTVSLALAGCKSSSDGDHQPAGDTEDQGGGDTDTSGKECTEFLGADDGCDCGCDEPDPDCGGNGCTEPGCDTATCEFCYDDLGNSITCTHEQAPAEWTCDQGAYDDALDLCDCGCGAPDPDCEEAGCSTGGCDAPACDFCNDAGEGITCAHDVPPVGWTCDMDAFNDGSDCDCGCGGIDADCEGTSCSEPGCDAQACYLCHDETGENVPCTKSTPPPEWACEFLYYNEPFDDCDCGCGAPDPDCAGEGCSDASCSAPACEFCYDADGAPIGCE
jgi:hypothetical protein